MLINCDIKGLEVVVAAQLSGDPVLCQEILERVDIHDANRVRFGLGGPTGPPVEGESQDVKAARKAGRLIAKIFKFR